MYIAVYIVAVAVFIFMSAVYISDMKNRDISLAENAGKLKKRLKTAAFTASAVNAVLGIADIARILKSDMFVHIFLFIGIVSAVETVIYLLYMKLGFKTLRFSAKVIFISSLLELTVFNYPSFYLWNSDFKEQSVEISKAYYGSENSFYDEQNNLIAANGAGEFKVSIENFNGRIGSVYADLDFGKDTQRVLFKIDAGDEAQKALLRTDYISRYMVNGRINSQTVQTLFSGDVNEIHLRFILENPGDSVNLKGITFNKPIPFTVSVLRLTATVLIPILAYIFYAAAVMKRKYEKGKRFCNWGAAIITAAFCAMAVGTVAYRLETPLAEEMKQTKGNQITQELVDAFSNGQVNLLAEPSAELLGMDNPYDRTERDVVGCDFEWDHLLYDGAYFSYYGIAPVLLLFWPYHSLTGYYFPSTIAVLLFAVIGMVGLSLAYMTFIRKWFGGLSTGMALAGLIIIQLVSGIWFCIGRPDIYEIAESAGFAFLTWGAWLLFDGNIIGPGKISFVKTALSSLILAVSVLCRPTLAVYCICAAIFMIYAIPRSASVTGVSGSNIRRSRYIVYILCAAVPMLLIALIQMWYNYVRFGSPFDFGIQYSLTINDFTNAQYHSKLSLVPVFNYLFGIPSFVMRYPFVYTEYQSLDVEGFLYADLITKNTSGIFFLVLPAFAYFLSGKALKMLPDKKSRILSILYIGLPCVIMPVIIMAAVWESGYSIRYTVDFSWEMAMGAFAVFFCIYLNMKNQTVKKLMKKFFMFSMVWAIAVSGFQIADQMFNNSFNSFPEIQYSIEQAFAFWK